MQEPTEVEIASSAIGPASKRAKPSGPWIGWLPICFVFSSRCSSRLRLFSASMRGSSFSAIARLRRRLSRSWPSSGESAESPRSIWFQTGSSRSWAKFGATACCRSSLSARR